MGRICDICNTDLGEQTDYNFNRHRNSNQCQANQKKTSIKASSQSIKSYLKPSCLQPSGLGTTKLNELHSKEATRPNSIDLIDDKILVDSNRLMNYDLITEINPHKRKTYDDSEFNLSTLYFNYPKLSFLVPALNYFIIVAQKYFVCKKGGA